MSKKNNRKKEATGGGAGHFLKHYFGYVLLAFLCAVVTVLVVYISQNKPAEDAGSSAQAHSAYQAAETQSYNITLLG